MAMTKVAVGCDHGGFILKESVVSTLERLGAEVVDLGCYDESSVDYPVYGEKVARSVASGECALGVIMCGTGIGISIAANKVKGIRAALCHDCFSAKATREHNDANILAMGAENAFIINVPNAKVITAITQEEMRENIFTNIDGAVFL